MMILDDLLKKIVEIDGTETEVEEGEPKEGPAPAPPGA